MDLFIQHSIIFWEFEFASKFLTKLTHNFFSIIFTCFVKGFPHNIETGVLLWIFFLLFLFFFFFKSGKSFLISRLSFYSHFLSAVLLFSLVLCCFCLLLFLQLGHLPAYLTNDLFIYCIFIKKIKMKGFFAWPLFFLLFAHLLKWLGDQNWSVICAALAF